MTSAFHKIVDQDVPSLAEEYKRAAKRQKLAYITQGKLIVTDFAPAPKLTRTMKRAIRNAVNYQADVEAEQWARDHSAKLVRGVDDVTRQAIRALVAGLRGGHYSDNDVVQVVSSIVGLTDRQSNTLKSMVGSPEQIEAYVKGALNARAKLIAHHETLMAANMGLSIAYRRGLELGILSERSRKVWRTETDSRVCPVCKPVARTQARLDGKFRNGLEAPPAHVGCRCTMTLNIANS